MEKKIGIENLKKVLEFIYNSSEAIEQVVLLKSFKGLAALLPDAMKLPTVQWSQLDDEFRDLSPQEKSELIEHMKKEFDLENDVAELVVEKCFELSIKGYDLVVDFIGLFKRK